MLVPANPIHFINKNYDKIYEFVTESRGERKKKFQLQRKFIYQSSIKSSCACGEYRKLQHEERSCDDDAAHYYKFRYEGAQEKKKETR